MIDDMHQDANIDQFFSLYPDEFKNVPPVTDVVIREPDGWESFQESMGFT